MKFYNSPDFLFSRYSLLLEKDLGLDLLNLQLAFRAYLCRFINMQSSFSQSFLVVNDCVQPGYDFEGFSVNQLQFVFTDSVYDASDLVSNHLIVNNRMLSFSVLEQMYVMYFLNRLFESNQFYSLDLSLINLNSYNCFNLEYLVADLAFSNGFESNVASSFELGQFILTK